MKKKKRVYWSICILLALWSCQQAEEKEPQEELYSYEIYLDEKGEEAVCIKEYIGRELDVTVPEELEGRPVRKLGEGVFEVVHEVTLPDSLYEIGDKAFSGSTVKKVYMGEGIKRIGHFAFSKCYLLEELATAHSQDGLSSLPHSIWVIGKEAFSYCWSLKGIELPENLLWISEYTFLDCVYLEKVLIHESVEIIGFYAFHDCINLKEVEIKGEGLKRVDILAFDSSLEETIPFPDGATFEIRTFMYQ